MLLRVRLSKCSICSITFDVSRPHNLQYLNSLPRKDTKFRSDCDKFKSYNAVWDPTQLAWIQHMTLVKLNRDTFYKTEGTCIQKLPFDRCFLAATHGQAARPWVQYFANGLAQFAHPLPSPPVSTQFPISVDRSLQGGQVSQAASASAHSEWHAWRVSVQASGLGIHVMWTRVFSARSMPLT